MMLWPSCRLTNREENQRLAVSCQLRTTKRNQRNYFLLKKTRNTSNMDTSFITCSKARLSSSCFCLCSAIFSANFLGFAILEMYDRACCQSSGVPFGHRGSVCRPINARENSSPRRSLLRKMQIYSTKILLKVVCARKNLLIFQTKIIILWLCPRLYETPGIDAWSWLSTFFPWQLVFPQLSLIWGIFNTVHVFAQLAYTLRYPFGWLSEMNPILPCGRARPTPIHPGHKKNFRGKPLLDAKRCRSFSKRILRRKQHKPGPDNSHRNGKTDFKHKFIVSGKNLHRFLSSVFSHILQFVLHDVTSGS